MSACLSVSFSQDVILCTSHDTRLTRQLSCQIVHNCAYRLVIIEKLKLGPVAVHSFICLTLFSLILPCRAQQRKPLWQVEHPRWFSPLTFPRNNNYNMEPLLGTHPRNNSHHCNNNSNNNSNTSSRWDGHNRSPWCNYCLGLTMFRVGLH